MKIPRDERQAVISKMRQVGMSYRAIGAATGIDERTVRRARAANAAPESITGLDGKQYRAPEVYPATSPAELIAGSSTAAEVLLEPIVSPEDEERRVRRALSEMHNKERRAPYGALLGTTRLLVVWLLLPGSVGHAPRPAG